MTAKPKPTLRRVREYTESLAAAYLDRVTDAAKRGDMLDEHVYKEVLRVLTTLVGVMQ